MTPEDIHALLLAESTRVALPEAYHRDVTVHDLAELRATGSQLFIWVLRTCGSHLVRLDNTEPSESETDIPAHALVRPGHVRTSGRITPAHFLECISRMDGKQLYYHFDGARLKSVTLDQAKRIASGLPPGTVWPLVS